MGVHTTKYPKGSRNNGLIKSKHHDAVRASSDTEYTRLKRSYSNSKKFDDINKKSGHLNDLLDDLENKGIGYEIYDHKQDNGCTVFYDDDGTVTAAEDWDNVDTSSNYRFIKTKSVQDSDGFYTDYTLYYDPDTETYFTMFGDRDAYGPDPSYADYEADSEEVAMEWFDSYNGFADDEDDIESSADIHEEIRKSDQYKPYALQEYVPGDSETGIEGDKFYILDVVRAADEEEAYRYFKRARMLNPGAYVSEISEEDFEEFQRYREEIAQYNSQYEDDEDDIELSTDINASFSYDAKDQAIQELAMDGEISLGKCSKSTLYRWAREINDRLESGKYDWRVKPNPSDNSLKVTNITSSSINCSRNHKNPWEVSIIESTPYVLGKDYYYDSVENLLYAGWGDVVDIVTDLGYVSNGDVIIPKGTRVRISDEGVNHYYNSMMFDDGSWIPVRVEDVITEIDPNAQEQVEGSVQLIHPFKMIGRYEDDYEAEVGGFDESDCMDKLIRLTDKHGELTWYSGVSDEDYEAGEYVGRENFVYSSEDFEEYEEDIKEIDQEFTSENTSINSTKLPAVFKMVSFAPGTINIDYGGGRFDNVADYLTQYDVINLVYDPYNRTPEHNKEVIKTVRRAGGADTATCSNVLNVIKEPEVRKNVLQNIKKLVKPSGKVYITVYEGNGSGEGGPTKSGYQVNRKTADYLEEIQEVFPNTKRKGKLIVANNSSSGIESVQKIVADYLDPPEYGDPEEVDPWKEFVELDVDCYVIVDSDGYWDYCNENGSEEGFDVYEDLGFIGGYQDSWESEQYPGVTIARNEVIYDDFEKLLTPCLPAEAGIYHITCDPILIYEISEVYKMPSRVRTYDEDGIENMEIYGGYAESKFLIEESEITNFKFKKVK